MLLWIEPYDKAEELMESKDSSLLIRRNQQGIILM